MRARYLGVLTVLAAVAALAVLGLSRRSHADVVAGEYSMEAVASVTQDEVGGATFSVDLAINFAGGGGCDGLPGTFGCYQAAQWFLDYDETLVDAGANCAGAASCAQIARIGGTAGACGGEADNGTRVLAGCISLSGADLDFAGGIFRITFNCTGNGLAPFTLVTAGSTTFVDDGNGARPAHVHSASVMCGAEPTPTDTAPPTSTPTATATPTMTPTSTPTRTPGPAAPAEIFLVSPSACLVLRPSAAAACLNGFTPGRFADPNARAAWTSLVLDADGDGTVTAAEVGELSLLSGNQLHEDDGDLVVVLMVANDDPATFQTEEGLFSVTSAPVEFDEAFTCQFEPVFGGLRADEDCDGDGIAGDGIVYAQLHGEAGLGARGEHQLDVLNALAGNVIATTPYVIVGEPNAVAAAPAEVILQAGLDPADCRLPEDLSGFDEVIAAPETTAVFATVTDDAGTAVSGGWITWSSSDANVASLATATGVTLDLGTRGIVAPDVICGLQPGTATITLMLAIGPNLGGTVIILDPGAAEVSVTFDVTVLPPDEGCAGDLDGDGSVTGRDAAIVARNLRGQDLIADVNGDGKVSLLDLQAVLKARHADGC